MGRSQRLRDSDVVQVHRLCCDLVELRTHPEQQDRHMLASLCTILGATRAASFCWSRFGPASPRFVLHRFEYYGWEGPDQDRFLSFVHRGEFREDDVIDAAAMIPANSVTCTRRDVIPAEYYWEKARDDGHDRGVGSVSDLIGCFFRHQKRDQVSAIALHRLDGESGFEQRAFATLQLFNEFRQERYARGDLGILADGECSLTPAEQEVCSLYLKGLDPHEIAKKLHRALGTIRTHIRSLHRKLGVTSVNELFQRFTRPSDEWRR